MLAYLVHRILIMIPTLIAISVVIFTIINLPPGDYFSTFIAELQSTGEAADLAKIHFLQGAILLLGSWASPRRYGLFFCI
jgi:peptide/nickel transport system permease protein